jgi:hypothetical protein
MDAFQKQNLVQNLVRPHVLEQHVRRTSESLSARLPDDEDAIRAGVRAWLGTKEAQAIRRDPRYAVFMEGLRRG